MNNEFHNNLFSSLMRSYTFNDLILFSDPSYNYGTFWMLGLIIVVLGYWSFQNPERTEG